MGIDFKEKLDSVVGGKIAIFIPMLRKIYYIKAVEFNKKHKALKNHEDWRMRYFFIVTRSEAEEIEGALKALENNG